MKEFENRLTRLGCSQEVQRIILTAIREVKLRQDKPKDKEITNLIQKELSRLMKNED